MRVELLDQVGVRTPTAWSQTKFTRLATLYEAGKAVNKGGRVRMVKLADEFLASLLEQPTDREDPVS